jgi:hypothetical protein
VQGGLLLECPGFGIAGWFLGHENRSSSTPVDNYDFS